MNIHDCKEAVRVAYELDLPIFILGPPGLGKSSIIYQLANEMPMMEGPRSVIELRSSTADPSEIADLKAIVDGKVVNVQQDWVPTDEAVAAGKYPKFGFILLDEVLDGAMMVQSALQNLVLDRKLGSAKLAKGWFPVAASNRRSDGAAAGRMSTALASRFMIVEAEHDLDVTIAFAYKNDWNPILPAFLRFRPNLLDTFQEAKKAGQASYACGRTWEMVSRLTKGTVPESIRLELLSGLVGQGTAAEFYAFERTYKSLPDMNEIRNHPETAAIPTEPSVLYATIGSLVAKITVRELERVWPYVVRLSPEHCTMFINDAKHQLDKAIKTTKAWNEYVQKFGQYTY